MEHKEQQLQEEMSRQIDIALREDLGSGDISAALIDEHCQGRGLILCREQAVICGQPWVDQLFRSLSPRVAVEWLCDEGSEVAADSPVANLSGPARALLSGERSALNFLQLLSGTATQCRKLINIVQDFPVKILDTRKTVPGLRLAQKYAIRCGGGNNHRMGLYDACLIKDNHIRIAGTLNDAIRKARLQNPDCFVQIEVSTLEELSAAVSCSVDAVLLDNFSVKQMHAAVELAGGRIPLEASGNIDESNVLAVARTGVDRISIGGLTKNIRAIDFSMKLYAGSQA